MGLCSWIPMLDVPLESLPRKFQWVNDWQWLLMIFNDQRRFPHFLKEQLPGWTAVIPHSNSWCYWTNPRYSWWHSIVYYMVGIQMQDVRASSTLHWVAEDIKLISTSHQKSRADIYLGDILNPGLFQAHQTLKLSQDYPHSMLGAVILQQGIPWLASSAPSWKLIISILVFGTAKQSRGHPLAFPAVRIPKVSGRDSDWPRFTRSISDSPCESSVNHCYRPSANHHFQPLPSWIIMSID